MDFTFDFSSAQETISQALVATTRSTAQLSAEDLSFHRSLNHKIGRSVDRQSSRLLALTQKLLQRCKSSDAPQLSLPDVESIEAKWSSLVDVADGLLERTDTCLDEFNGLVKRATPRDGARSPAPTPRSFGSRKGYGSHAQTLAKPQLSFDTLPDNDATPPFKPFLESKPHAVLSLQSSLNLDRCEGNLQYSHPYQAEITNYEYPPFVYTRTDPIPYTPFNTTTATFVDDLDGVYQMLEELKKAPAIAIDLEHHDTHSYIGLVSLMQISTRDQDWIVDTLKPWRRKLHVLNEVFADPGILKVLHGAFMDIVWLQRDLGLYVVGLFDTHHASRVLGYPGGSLAYLLKFFVNFDAQKQYQTADWRIRPLPQEMFEYARSDTHFLLFVFDNMRNDLVERSDFDNPDQDKVQAVLEKSKETALQRYEITSYDVERGLGRYGWFEQLQRAPVMLSKEQFSVFRKVHQWRDTVARQEDESPHQIMAKHAVINIAQVLPKDVPTLLGLLHPISQPLRLRANELLEVISTAQVEGSEGPDMYELLTLISAETGGHVTRRLQPNVSAVTETVTGPLLQSAQNSSLESYRAESSFFWGSTLQVPMHNFAPLLPREAFSSATPLLLNGLLNGSSHPPFENYDMQQEQRTHGDFDGPIADSGNTVLGKRKLLGDPVEDDDDAATHRSASGGATTEHDAVDPASLRKMKRRDKKILKQAITAEAGEANKGGSGDQQAFDYSTAPSVLHADKSTPGLKKGGKPAGFNPYAKAADAPPGIKSEYRSKSGKSHTFKN